MQNNLQKRFIKIKNAIIGFKPSVRIEKTDYNINFAQYLYNHGLITSFQESHQNPNYFMLCFNFYRGKNLLKLVDSLYNKVNPRVFSKTKSKILTHKAPNLIRRHVRYNQFSLQLNKTSPFPNTRHFARKSYIKDTNYTLISTSKGLITTKEALDSNVGGILITKFHNLFFQKNKTKGKTRQTKSPLFIAWRKSHELKNYWKNKRKSAQKKKQLLRPNKHTSSKKHKYVPK